MTKHMHMLERECVCAFAVIGRLSPQDVTHVITIHGAIIPSFWPFPPNAACTPLEGNSVLAAKSCRHPIDRPSSSC